MRRCQCCEVQPSACFGSYPTNTAMEPHRWLPLEANPDVSARLGEGGREGGWRRGEGSGPLRVQHRGLRDGWWGQGAGELLACGFD